MTLRIESLVKTHWTSVSKIYAQGIKTGLATFETEVPDWDTWNNKHIVSCRIVATINDVIIGFGVLSPVSIRKVYEGVAEVTVYVAAAFRGQHIGEAILKQLIIDSEAHGFWTLQAGIFSENIASIELHKKCGFRIVGYREKIGQLNGTWHNNHFLERRSKSNMLIK
ncbi:N-acetyltransferase [Flavobacteriales bacterium 34_180_T64]|nr:N-acetyltransferase [Flavobacteriales bacterium 34_180_T64]